MLTVHTAITRCHAPVHQVAAAWMHGTVVHIAGAICHMAARHMHQATMVLSHPATGNILPPTQCTKFTAMRDTGILQTILISTAGIIMQAASPATHMLDLVQARTADKPAGQTGFLRSSGIYAGRCLPKAASPKERKAGGAAGNRKVSKSEADCLSWK